MSIEINCSNFNLLFPELEIDNDLFYILKEFAKREVSDKIWGKFYEEGVLTLIAHLLCIRNNNKNNLGTPLFPVSSTSVGSVSVGFSVPTTSTSDEYYSNSAYGKRFLHLRNLTKTYVITS